MAILALQGGPCLPASGGFVLVRLPAVAGQRRAYEANVGPLPLAQDAVGLTSIFPWLLVLLVI